MTDQISTLIPSLCNVGTYIQDNVLQGYRLVDGSPSQYGWQYEVVMIKEAGKDSVAPTVSVTEAPKKAGRPPKQG